MSAESYGRTWCPKCSRYRYYTLSTKQCVICGRPIFGKPQETAPAARTEPEEATGTEWDLFVAHARKSDPETSHEAAASVRVRESQEEVLKLFRRYRQMSDNLLVETARREGVQQSESGLRTRRSELVEMGRIEDSGARIRLPSGRNSIVWRIASDKEARNDRSQAGAA